MKKKLLSIMAAILAVGMLAGCGATENGTTESSAAEGSTTPLKDMEVEKYVSLGEYKGLEVTVAPISIEESEIEELTFSLVQNMITAENGITDRAIENGDVANIDYVGKKDDVAFEGGTAQGYNLAIGSGSFIDGFEEGLVGVKPGETVDLDLTFPENYHSADLAGQKVVFTVTVNFIMPTEITDELVEKLGLEGVHDQDGLHEYVYNYLYAIDEENYNNSVKNAILEKFIASNTYQNIPEEMLAEYEAITRENITSTAEYYGTDVDSFTNAYYGVDFETFIDTYVQEAVKQDLALQAIANKEELNIGDEELEGLLLEHALAAGYLTVEEYIGETDKEEFREYFLYEKVLAYLVENAVVSEE